MREDLLNEWYCHNCQEKFDSKSEEMIPNNEQLYKDRSEEYEKILKKFLKAIPKSILKEHLIKYKIIKEDYLTAECEMVKKDPRTRRCTETKSSKML